MIALIQRVRRAHVEIEGSVTGKIGIGLLALIAIERSDEASKVDRLLNRLLGYRVFPDAAGRMNKSLTDIRGGLLLVPQFTLAAETRKGMRPSFAAAADPELGELLFNRLLEQAQHRYHDVATGRFGANMQVHLINDGPVTFWLQV